MVNDENYLLLQGRRLLSDIGELLRGEKGNQYKDVSLISREGSLFWSSSLLLGSASRWIRMILLEGVDCIVLPDVSSSELKSFLLDLESEPLSKANVKSFLSVGRLLGVEFPSSSKTTTSLFPCHLCEKTFSLSKLLSRHLRVLHSPHPQHECSLCQQRCRSKSELLIHSRTHAKAFPCCLELRQTSSSTLPQNNVCEICGLKLGSRVAVKRHIRIHQRPDVKEMSDMEDEEEDEEVEEGESEESIASYECMACEKSFTQKSHLSVHEKGYHQNLRPNMCPVCGKTFSVASNMKKHLLLHESLKESSEDKQGSLKHVCEYCGRLFESLHYLRIHVKTHVKEPPHFPCGECLQEFSTLSALKIHQKSHTGEAQFTCTICKRTCVSKSALETHVLIHTGYKPHQCDQCDKRFTQKSQLNYHLRTVHASVHDPRPKTHFCPQCDKGFYTSSALNKHKKSHNQERNFKCNECGKAFIQKAHLKTHFLQHTGEKSFVCVVCGKAFFTNSNLKEHAKIHTGEKKKVFECPICSSSYVNASDLKVHLLKHSGESPFPCSVCKKSFRSKRHLEAHAIIHNGEKDLRCSNCFIAFTSPSDLRQHLRQCLSSSSIIESCTLKKIDETQDSSNSQIFYDPSRSSNTSIDLSQEEQSHLLVNDVPKYPMFLSGPDEDSLGYS